MASNSVSIAWLLPLMVLAPIGLTHCIGSIGSPEKDEPGDDGGPMAAPDGGPKAAPDGGQKTGGDSGKTQDDSGKTPGDASSKQPGDGATPTGDAGGPAVPPDAGGGSPGSVPCNGAPCDVSHGYVCCVTWTSHGPAEACNPPHSACWGHTVSCDDEDDCDNAVCCQDFPSGGLAGSASCKESCDTHTCQQVPLH